MPDTGAPWNIPYVESTDLVSDWPTDSLALANAIDSGLDAAGGLVAVKHALFTGTQSNSTASGANFAVTDLSITHEVADAANKLIISMSAGVLASAAGVGRVAIAVDDGTGLIAIGDADGSRVRIHSGGGRITSGSSDSQIVLFTSSTFVHTPGSGSKTYSLRVINTSVSTRTIYVNRDENDGNGASTPRGVSSLVIQEVKV